MSTRFFYILNGKEGKREGGRKHGVGNVFLHPRLFDATMVAIVTPCFGGAWSRLVDSLGLRKGVERLARGCSWCHPQSRGRSEP